MSERLPVNEQPRSLAVARREDVSWTLGWSAASLAGAGGFAALMSLGLLPISAPWWPWLLMLPSGVVLAQASLRYERNGHRFDAAVLSLTWSGSMILLLALALLIPLSWLLVGAVAAGSYAALWMGYRLNALPAPPRV